MGHRYAFLDAPVPLAFAHRGGAHEVSENSMTAFTRAVASGYTYLETDVHATLDAIPVAFHDVTVDRMLGSSGRVADLRWRDLSTLRDGGEAVVPRLADLLDTFGQARFNVDLKADSAVDPTIETIWKTNARDRVLLASFSDKRIRWARQVCGPRQATSMGRREAAALRLGSLHGRGLSGFVPGVPAVQVPVRYGRVRVVDARFIRYAHRLGMQVHVWTINDPAEMHELLDLGVDGIMTDRIEVLRDVLIARGRWPSGRPAGPERAA
jgi:glycerophosphoryl diester phosphodiesterase